MSDAKLRPRTTSRRTAARATPAERAQVRAEAKRRAFIDSAIKLFAEQGPDGTTMSDIVADAGGSKETLYRHFPSKEALFAAVVTQSLADVDFDSVERLLAAEQALPVRIRDFARAYLDHIIDPRLVMLRRMMSPDRSKRGREVYEQIVVPPWRSIADCLEREMQGGALRAADPWRCAMHLKALIEGEYPALLDIDAIDQPAKCARLQIADAASEAFLRAYAPGSDPPR